MKKVEIFRDGEDSGYLGRNRNWWYDPDFEHAFEIFDLDGFYTDEYYAQDHVEESAVANYADHVLHYARLMLGRDAASVLEIGCAGGWFTMEFLRRGIDVQALEGSRSGNERALRRGVPPDRLMRHDVRKPLDLGRKFDIVVCTEVAEHVEPPFSSVLINNITSHGDVVWFSFTAPAEHEAHYHHCNEQPEKFWRNLFDFAGFDMIRLPKEAVDAVQQRGGYIFYKKGMTLTADMAAMAAGGGAAPAPVAALGHKTDRHRREPGWKTAAKRLLPPIIIDAAKAVLGPKK